LRNRTSVILLLAGLLALAAAIFLPASSSHPVTPAMLTAAGAKSGSRVPEISLEGSDGRMSSIAEIAGYRPAVLIFIKDGCPCSELAERYFQRLHAIYGAHAAFVGVIDGDAAVARSWASRHQSPSPFPVLADPDQSVIRACGAERSAYVALVSLGGAIDRLWPGYSAEMLAELGSQLAAKTGLSESPIDHKDAPKALSSGCAF
jgi:peroxiredoxin